MSDEDELDDTEALPLERTVSPSTLAALSNMSRRQLNHLSGQVRDQWYDLWVGDEEPAQCDEMATREAEVAMARFSSGGYFFDLTGDRPLFEVAVAQLDPVWLLNARQAEELYMSLWLGVGELSTREEFSWFSRLRKGVRRLVSDTP